MIERTMRRTSLLAWFWALPVVLLLLAQVLGQWHRVAHPSAGHLHGHALEHVDSPALGHAQGHEATSVAAAQAQHGAGWLEQLFDADGHAASCVLYDQLAHADGLPSVPLSWLPPAWVPATLAWQACWQLAAQAAGYLARGPPGRG